MSTDIFQAAAGAGSYELEPHGQPDFVNRPVAGYGAVQPFEAAAGMGYGAVQPFEAAAGMGAARGRVLDAPMARSPDDWRYFSSYGAVQPFEAAAGMGGRPIAYEAVAGQRRSGFQAAMMATNPLLGVLGQVIDAAKAPPASAPTMQTASVVGPAALAVGFGTMLFGLAIRGAAGYFAGAAMAPDVARRSKYAWGGVAAAILGGAVGLGIEGAIAARAK